MEPTLILLLLGKYKYNLNIYLQSLNHLMRAGNKWRHFYFQKYNYNV